MFSTTFELVHLYKWKPFRSFPPLRLNLPKQKFYTMNQNELLLKCLQQYHSVECINQYFDLVKKLLTEFEIENDDPRLAFTINKKYRDINLNLGNRYILQPRYNEYLGCIVPVSFEEETVGGTFVFPFKQQKEVEAKFIELLYPTGTQFPKVLYNNCVESCAVVLKRYKKGAPFRKDHSDLLYEFTMEKTVRDEILGELESEPV